MSWLSVPSCLVLLSFVLPLRALSPDQGFPDPSATPSPLDSGVPPSSASGPPPSTPPHHGNQAFLKQMRTKCLKNPQSCIKYFALMGVNKLMSADFNSLLGSQSNTTGEGKALEETEGSPSGFWTMVDYGLAKVDSFLTMVGMEDAPESGAPEGRQANARLRRLLRLLFALAALAKLAGIKALLGAMLAALLGIKKMLLAAGFLATLLLSKLKCHHHHSAFGGYAADFGGLLGSAGDYSAPPFYPPYPYPPYQAPSAPYGQQNGN